ncbi:MAG TPA: cell division protein FtsA [Patescibacteria group bacterium]|nr:cell division protein FtsA [Patescibacteria group bacterium]
MKNTDIITGIDLGSDTIRIAVGSITPEGELQIQGLSEGPSDGINKGVIVNIEDTVSSISACLERAEKVIGQPIEHAFVGISGDHIISQESHGVVSVSKTDGEIKTEDIKRVLKAAETVAKPSNYKILHVLPRSYSVDNQPGILNPIGMTGVRLEVDTQIILGLSNQIRNLNKVFHRIGVEIDRHVFTVIATAHSVLTKRQKELGVAIVNLGSATTSVAIYEEGDILTAKVLPIGSRHITNDIAIGLRANIDLAEAVKINYGTSLPSSVKTSETIDLNELDKDETEVVSRKKVANIIRARAEEIFSMVNETLDNVGRKEKLPAGIVLTGAGSKLDGLVETAKEEFKMPACVGEPGGFESGIKKAFDSSYATATGLVLWGKGKDSLDPPSLDFKKIKNKANKIIKKFLPL